MEIGDLSARARRIRLLSCDVDGVLTDGRLYYADDGRELKAFSSLDGLGIKMLERCGITVAWITGSRSPAVLRRADDLGVRHVALNSEEKLSVRERLREELSLESEQCAHIGDDLPDLPLLMRSGLAVAVPHAPESIKRRVHYVTRASGGDGAVRELAELILAAQGSLEAMLRAYDPPETADGRGTANRQA